MSKPHASLFIVDDDPADIALLEAYLDDAPFTSSITTASDGVDCLEQLRGGLQPDLVVLDLNMPRKDGFETLKDIRADAKLRDLKVIVLTTSDQDHHIMQSFDLEANFFVTKPARPEQFDELLTMMHDFLQAYVWK